MVKKRGVNNLTERVPVGRLVGCKYFLSGRKENTLLARVCQGKALNEYLAYRGHPVLWMRDWVWASSMKSKHMVKSRATSLTVPF